MNKTNNARGHLKRSMEFVNISTTQVLKNYRKILTKSKQFLKGIITYETII